MTTSKALYAAILLMINHPDVQSRAYEEIEYVIGSRQPNITDRSNCPYMESMVFEILRYITHQIIGLPHETTTDTTLQGHNIPKGTQVNI